MSPDELQQWHRWFGLAWTDQLTGQPFRVELEMDLSLKQQFLDVVVLRCEADRPLTVELPDGFEQLLPHNLISFKSFQEAFDLDALYELLGHAVNYRKQKGQGNWLDQDQVGLFAVSVRYPQSLAAQVQLQQRSQGVYDVQLLGPWLLRLVVIHQLPLIQRNAMLHAFSFQQERARYGCENYQRRTADISSILWKLLQRYRAEGFDMPYTIKDFNRETLPEILNELEEEEVQHLLKRARLLERIPIEKRLEDVPVEKRLTGLSDEQARQLLQLLQQRLQPEKPDDAKEATPPSA